MIAALRAFDESAISARDKVPAGQKTSGDAPHPRDAVPIDRLDIP
jgi:hypothetical protein